MTKKGLSIKNMVVSVEFADSIDLNKISEKLKDVEYSPEVFPGLTFRIKDPKSTALIFSSGKMNCTGTRSMKDTRKVIDIILKSLQKVGVKVRKPKLTVQNIVATADLGERVDLDKIVFKVESAEYEPEQFPGLVYRMKNPKVAFLIFSSGKVVETGARDEKMMNEAFRKLKRNLRKIGILKGK